MKHLPLVILGLTLLSAVTVLVLGIQFAREKKTIVTDESRIPATAFTARFLGEIDDLTELYEQHLLNIFDTVSRTGNKFEITSSARNIIGVEQITVFSEGNRKTVFEIHREFPDPFETGRVPRFVGEDSRAEGILIDLEKIRRDDFERDHWWIENPGYELHFAAKSYEGKVVVFRISREKTTEAIVSRLKQWMPNAIAPVDVAQIDLSVKSPAGTNIGQTGTGQPPTEPPSLLLPVPSRFGDWHIASWDKTETITNYRQPVLLGASALSIIIAIAGLLGFFQQNRAVRLAEQRVSFVNRVSHELRTPLTNIMLNIDLAADTIDPDSQPAASKRLLLINEETRRLSRLLENVLTFSQREKSKADSEENGHQPFRFEPCTLETTVDEILEQFAPALERKNLRAVKTVVAPGVKAFTDPDALNQIVSNLISNVEKYAANGRTFEIEIAANTDRNLTTLAISDHGPGIQESDIARIFRPFIRLTDKTTEGVSGTGLGLAIASDLAEAMGGELSVSPRKDEGAGARFELTLPLAAENLIPISAAS